MSLMIQSDLKKDFKETWSRVDQKAASQDGLRFSNPVEDAVLYPIYKQLLKDMGVVPDGKSILDVGSGSGRWIRFFTENYSPARITGMDLAESSIALLRKWYADKGRDNLIFQAADLTSPELDLPGASFDLINIGNVFFHIVEPTIFLQAMCNVKKMLAPNGIVVTTEYLPKTSYRTRMMMVYSQDDFQQVFTHAGLEIVAVKAFSFFSNDPMGMDFYDRENQQDFQKVRMSMQKMLEAAGDANMKKFLHDFFVDLEHALLGFCNKRISNIDCPSQKLVVLRHCGEANRANEG